MQTPKQNVVQRPGDPYIYLFVMGEWYCYNPSDEPLGSGAMGTVYLGFRCKNGEKIAVKRVKDCFANNKMIRDRAKQEASLAFRHQNLVEMIGYCEYGPNSGPVFILSKFVAGMQIDTYVKQYLTDATDKVDKICHVIYPILDALDYVHSRGVVHRDIKPSNIMIENESNIRLMDLGIARMNGGNQFSAFGFIGTPQYSAPEQITRDKNSSTMINAATDIYELGVTFYELLTGINPFDAPTEAETLSKQMKEALPYNDKIPKRLMQVIWKATEKDQSKRYQNATEFKTAIKQAMMPPASTTTQLQDWLERNQNICIGGIAGLAVIIILLLIFIL